MKTVRSSLLLICSILMLFGCKVDMHQASPDTVSVAWGSEHGNWKEPPVEYKIGEKDNFRKYIKALLEKEKTGWVPSLVSYLPYIKVTAENRAYTLNITPTHLVLNYKRNPDDKRMMQVVKKSSSEFFKSTLELIKKEYVNQQAEDDVQ